MLAIILYTNQVKRKQTFKISVLALVSKQRLK